MRARGSDGQTAVQVAGIHGRREVMELLRARGADLDVKNAQGLTARHLINLMVAGVR